jgi:hypothetical protein
MTRSYSFEFAFQLIGQSATFGEQLETYIAYDAVFYFEIYYYVVHEFVF